MVLLLIMKPKMFSLSSNVLKDYRKWSLKNDLLYGDGNRQDLWHNSLGKIRLTLGQHPTEMQVLGHYQQYRLHPSKSATDIQNALRCKLSSPLQKKQKQQNKSWSARTTRGHGAPKTSVCRHRPHSLLNEHHRRPRSLETVQYQRLKCANLSQISGRPWERGCS